MTWTAIQAAEYLKVRPKTARALAARGEVPAKKIGKEWRFDEDTLPEWFKNKTRENLKPCPSISAPRVRIGKSGSKSLASKLNEALKQQTSKPRPDWKTRSAVICGGKSNTGKSGTPGATR